MTNAENRKSTQMLVDFVRSKKFAGGIRPRVMVETMQLETGMIDIIVIKNGYSTPYVLEESYRGVANFDVARAEVVFGRGNKQENKDAFDSLYTHKAEIESALGTTLQWNRGDDIKSSKVFIQLNNVSIENETDWLQMANFHADWTKKFYDVIVPYIKQ